MKKLISKQKLMVGIAIILIAVIIAIVITTSIIKNNNKIASEGYLATSANANSNLVARYIKEGITIGGITGTLETLDTSDATATTDDITFGKTAYVNGQKITGTYVPSDNYTFTDEYGNKVQVPGGFAVINPEENVEDGIIIEDVSAKDETTKGNQFVWIPIGNIETSKGAVTIDLGRYEFNTTTGVPTLRQSADNWTQSVTLALYCTEGSSNGNATAKNLSDFISKTKENGGYYIGRYEAGDAMTNTETGPRTSQSSIDNQLVIRKGVYPYTYITQIEASTKSKNLYTGNGLESDLVNSYAWDTALVFIQKCSEDNDYSTQTGRNASLSTVMVGENILSVINNGDNPRDERCHIFDMAGNVSEWSTETRSTDYAPAIERSGIIDAVNFGGPMGRWGNQANGRVATIGYRVIIYF